MSIFEKFDANVLSFSTNGEFANMNMCANLIHISSNPMIFGIPVKKGTQTLENIKSTPRGLIQLLAEHQHLLLDVLGKQSGSDGNKLTPISGLEDHKGFSYLSDCLAFMEVEVIDIVEVGGDHVMAICKQIEVVELNVEDPLTMNFLREEGLWE